MRNFRSLLFAVALVIFSFAFSDATSMVSGQEARTWTSANGKHTFEAELVSYEDGVLKLKGKDGKVKELDSSKVSDDDRKYLNSLKAIAGAKITKEQKDRLKDLGLKMSSDEFSFLEERMLKSEISKSLKAKKKLIGMSLQLQQIRIAQLNAQNRIVVLKQENVQLNSGLANATTAKQNNQFVGLIRANQSSMELLQKNIDDLDKQIKEGQSFINKSREEFVEYVMSVRTLSDSFDEKAEAMKGSDEFVAVLADIEKTLGRKLKPFGESKSLARIRSNLAKLESVVLSDTIKLTDRGSGTFEATVSINGQEPMDLVVDSGASLVTIPSRLASKLKINVGPEARSIRMTIADGSTISGKLVILDSVRMGKFTAKNVECAVLGPEAVNAPNLLGMSFLGNFKFELDAAKGELTMMTVETED